MSSRLAKQPEGANVLAGQGVQLHFSVFNHQHRIERNIGLGVGIADAGEICSDRKMAPLPGFEFQGGAGERQAQGEHAWNNQSRRATRRLHCFGGPDVFTEWFAYNKVFRGRIRMVLT